MVKAQCVFNFDVFMDFIIQWNDLGGHGNSLDCCIVSISNQASMNKPESCLENDLRSILGRSLGKSRAWVIAIFLLFYANKAICLIVITKSCKMAGLIMPVINPERLHEFVF